MVSDWRWFGRELSMLEGESGGRRMRKGERNQGEKGEKGEKIL